MFTSFCSGLATSGLSESPIAQAPPVLPELRQPSAARQLQLRQDSGGSLGCGVRPAPGRRDLSQSAWPSRAPAPAPPSRPEELAPPPTALHRLHCPGPASLRLPAPPTPAQGPAYSSRSRPITVPDPPPALPPRSSPRLCRLRPPHWLPALRPWPAIADPLSGSRFPAALAVLRSTVCHANSACPESLPGGGRTTHRTRQGESAVRVRIGGREKTHSW